jgi:hypothetical protein
VLLLRQISATSRGGLPGSIRTARVHPRPEPAVSWLGLWLWRSIRGRRDDQRAKILRRNHLHFSRLSEATGVLFGDGGGGEREREIWRRGGGGNTDDKEGEEEEAEEEEEEEAKRQEEGLFEAELFQNKRSKEGARKGRGWRLRAYLNLSEVPIALFRAHLQQRTIIIRLHGYILIYACTRTVTNSTNARLLV